MEATNLADLYGLPNVEWERVRARLNEGMTQAPDTGGPNRHSCWLATINADGSPPQRHRFALAGRLVLVRDGGDHPQRAQPRPRSAMHIERRNARLRSRR